MTLSRLNQRRRPGRPKRTGKSASTGSAGSPAAPTINSIASNSVSGAACTVTLPSFTPGNTAVLFTYTDTGAPGPGTPPSIVGWDRVGYASRGSGYACGVFIRDLQVDDTEVVVDIGTDDTGVVLVLDGSASVTLLGSEYLTGTSSTFTAASVEATAASLVLHGVGCEYYGTISLNTPNGWTVAASAAGANGRGDLEVASQVVAAGTVTMPTWAAGGGTRWPNNTVQIEAA